jgi:hypothetical protein
MNWGLQGVDLGQLLQAATVPGRIALLSDFRGLIYIKTLKTPNSLGQVACEKSDQKILRRELIAYSGKQGIEILLPFSGGRDHQHPAEQPRFDRIASRPGFAFRGSRPFALATVFAVRINLLI